MALNSNALVTLSMAKTHLDIGNSDVSQDSKLEMLINMASDRIEQYLDRKLIYQQHTERIDGRASDRAILKHYPAEKPTQVYDDPGWDFLTAMDSGAYEIENSGVLVLKSGKFQRANLNIKVIYNAGYKSVISGGSGPTIPADIQYACLLFIEWMYQMRADRRIGIQGKGKQNENIRFSQGIPVEVLEILDPHRRLDAPLTSAPIGNS